MHIYPSDFEMQGGATWLSDCNLTAVEDKWLMEYGSHSLHAGEWRKKAGNNPGIINTFKEP
ncbi:hypothetical protein CEQ20_02700 [Yersinia pseudotuberculosis]|nr:hypothetical protein CEQ20_02700 [Yersinia pseudotuberculosis]AYX12091.1 hypothetical protein EGX52_15690 [Yersinia pseudotuberculosis]MBO1566535.1 hypothetical protein [Yersinia pseudotuberculosis]MBO1590313.1 hypothetical protein [Yersinia pseudotuberculosis]MBO1603476.1 hypothetical protein [Yersinia pseudotuberculosis]